MVWENLFFPLLAAVDFSVGISASTTASHDPVHCNAENHGGTQGPRYQTKHDDIGIDS
jgi:hypothetical protein